MDLFSTKIAYADFNGLLTNIDEMIINPLISLLFALAVVFFLYGVFEFIMNQENEEKKTTGKQHMVWGIVGITIMMGVWTILSIVVNTMGLSGQINPEKGTVNLPKP